MAVYNPIGISPVRLDVILTNISVGYTNAAFVGDVLFPTVRVRNKSDKYYVHGRETWRDEDDIRAPGTVANEIDGMELSTDTYYTLEHALQLPITDEEREIATAPLDPFADGTEILVSRILMGRELSIKTKVTATANYASGMSTTLSGTAQWNDYTNSNPIGDVKTGVQAVVGKFLGVAPNTGIFPYEVMVKLEDHPDFIERIKYSQVGIVTQDLMGALFGIPRILVPGLGQNTANPGQAVNLAYIWGKDVVLAYVPPRPGLRVPAFGYEFLQPYGSNVMPIDRWREEPRKSWLIRCQRRYDIKFIAVDANGDSTAGYLIKAAVA